PPAETAIFATQSKPFQPALSVGDRLAFALRVNATVARKDGAGRGRRHDVAMDALKDVASGGRAALRQERAESAARDWLETRAEVSGFRLTALRLHSYRAARLPRRGGAKASFGVFDLEGLLEIADPPAFLERLRQGFGRAKAFGCGLMLIRRAG
ncbi:MAG: type I-E CRISPR-associated protein Cas6/Cse3/CasE, partial [Pseudomonadota bacterium]